jgi:hypothetical protein
MGCSGIQPYFGRGVVGHPLECAQQGAPWGVTRERFFQHKLQQRDNWNAALEVGAKNAEVLLRQYIDVRVTQKSTVGGSPLVIEHQKRAEVVKLKARTACCASMRITC